MQGRRAGRAGAAGLAAPGMADGDAAGQAEADPAEGRFDRCRGLGCAGVWWWHRLSVVRIPQICREWASADRRVSRAAVL